MTHNTPQKLGLTGTPIENRLGELKALLDLTLPGYLGKDADFENRYVKPIENHGNEERRVQLSNLISPFTLRRKKESVLDDLPEKIEDLRTCTLSEDQVKLYRDAVSAKGNELLKNLRQKEKIAAIISKKRNLMDSVIEESDPTIMKSSTREALIDLLAIPQLESSAVF